MASTIQNVQYTQPVPSLIAKLASQKMKSDTVTPSKLLANGPYIDLFLAKFKCTRCGACEHIGSVVVDWDDIRRFAKFLNINEHTFAAKYTTTASNGTKLLKQPCPFYDEAAKGCTCYSERCKVCRLFPLYTIICKDELYHLGVRSECKEAIKTLKELEEEIWSKEPIIK